LRLFADSSGIRIPRSDLGDFQYAIGIALVSGGGDSGHHAWVADNGNNRVTIFDVGAPAAAAACAWTPLAKIDRIGGAPVEGEAAAASASASEAAASEAGAEGGSESGSELGGPFDVVLAADGRLALVSVPEQHAVHVFDAATRAHVRTIGMAPID
jgi:hypothetical protein